MNTESKMIFEAYGTIYRGDKTEQDSKDYSMNLVPFMGIIHKLAKGTFDTDSDQDLVSKGELQGIFEVEVVDGHRQVVLTNDAIKVIGDMHPELKDKFWECGKCKADYAGCGAAKHNHQENAEGNTGKKRLKYDYEWVTAFLPRDLDISNRAGQEKVLDLAFKETLRLLVPDRKNPRLAANNMFGDEDFPGEIISQYAHYQQHGFPDASEDGWYASEDEDAEDRSVQPGGSIEDITDVQNKSVHLLKQHGFHVNKVSNAHAEQMGGPVVYMGKKTGAMHQVAEVDPQGMINEEPPEEYVQNYVHDEDAENAQPADVSNEVRIKLGQACNIVKGLIELLDNTPSGQTPYNEMAMTHLANLEEDLKELSMILQDRMLGKEENAEDEDSEERSNAQHAAIAISLQKAGKKPS